METNIPMSLNTANILLILTDSLLPSTDKDETGDSDDQNLWSIDNF